MENDYQIEIPATFMALFMDPGRDKPNASRELVATRYDLCEDMANLLVEPAMQCLHGKALSERQVLEQMRQGLCGENAVVSASELSWLICRLAELLQWPQLDQTPSVGTENA